MTRRSDEERRLWVLNDEGLYRSFLAMRRRMNLRVFIQENRAEIDAVIDAALGPRRPMVAAFEPNGRLP